MIRCPSCNNHMSCKIDYNYGNPIVIYTCDNCRYTTFGEAYITYNKTDTTIGSSMTTSSIGNKYKSGRYK